MPLITDNATLLALCHDLKTEEFITVDTEFLRDKTYFPQLCLIQIASSTGAFAIDPLAPGINLNPLFDILSDNTILKVFHSARQDIEILLGLSGVVPAPLFDTQIAAMVCGFGEAASYETLVTKLTKCSIDKSCRFTDWSQRPLTERQYAYALSDVIHLREVYLALLKTLEETNRISWLKEELSSLIDPKNYYVIPEDAWKKIKIKSSSPTFIRIVQALAHWRELKAQAHNMPRNHLLKEQVLLEIAAMAPATIEELRKIRNVGHMVLQPLLVDEILAVIHTAKHSTHIKPSTLDGKVQLVGNAPLVDLLKVLLKSVSSDHNVAEKLIATTQDLLLLASAGDHTSLTIPALHGWRFELFGHLALQLKEGTIALSAHENKVCVVPL